MSKYNTIKIVVALDDTNISDVEVELFAMQFNYNISKELDASQTGRVHVVLVEKETGSEVEVV